MVWCREIRISFVFFQWKVSNYNSSSFSLHNWGTIRPSWEKYESRVDWVTSRLGLNFINVLHTDFTLADPKSVKRYQWLKWSTSVKALLYVGEIETWGQFHQHSTTQLLRAQILKARKDIQIVILYCAFGIWACKSCL